MTSIISKKITVAKDRRSKQSNGAHARSLLEYMASPENVRGEEKCRHMIFTGIEPEPKCLDDVIEYFESLFFEYDIDEENRRSLLSHWVLSFSGDPPADEIMMDAAREFLRDLGYNEEFYPAAYAIHADTDNTHVHIMASRVSYVLDSPVQEGNGWWKNEAQKSNARLAKKYGWKLPNGAKFVCLGEKETVEEKHPITGYVSTYERFKARPVPHSPKKAKTLSIGAIRSEMRTNKKSKQRTLQELLIEFEKSIDRSWNWATFHNKLASIGVEAKIDYDVSNGLAYSLDGDNWFSPSKICNDLTQEALEKRFGDRRFRNARKGAKSILKEARKLIVAEDVMDIPKETIDRLRKIHIDDARQALGIKNKLSKSRNALDVAINEARMTYAKAVEKLAELFPTVASGEAVLGVVDRVTERIAEAGVPDTLRSTAQAVLKQLDSYGVNARFHVHMPKFTTKSRKPEGMTAQELLSKLSMFSAVSLGELDENNVRENAKDVYLQVLPAEDTILIPIDDIHKHPEFVSKYPPSVLLATSTNGRQAHYLVRKKYDTDFYNFVTAKLNAEYGDPAVRSIKHDTRLAGFVNRKQKYCDENGEYPLVHVIESSPTEREQFVALIESFYPEYEKQCKEKEDRAKAFASASSPVPSFASTPSPAKVLIPKSKESLDEAQRRMEYYETIIERAQEGAKRRGLTTDRSRCDFYAALQMYRAGATRHEVGQLLAIHQLQTPDPVDRPRKSDGTIKTVITAPNKDRTASRTADNAYKEFLVETAEERRKAVVQGDLPETFEMDEEDYGPAPR